jgi:uncharacterized membrane protein
MIYNPYEAPLTDRPAGPSFAAAPEPWSTGVLLEDTWEAFKRNAPVLIGATFLWIVTGFVPGTVVGFLEGTGVLEQESLALALANLGSSLFSLVAGAFFQVGQTRLWLEAARGRASLASLVSGGDRLLSMIAFNVMVGVAVTLGSLLCIVPGVILGVGLSMGSFFVVDAEMGPIEAMRASWAVTKGQKWSVLGFLLLAGLIGMCGFLFFCVGALATVPFAYLAQTLLYLRLSGRVERRDY